MRQEHPSLGERSARRTQWMERVQGGDGEAYRALLDDIGPAVLHFLRRRIVNAADVDDVYQEVFIALHRARHTYQPSRPLEPWLFAIARNVAADFRRRQRTRALREVLVESIPERGAEADRDLQPELARALDALPPGQREALTMLKFEGLSVAEAAARAGTTTGALKVRAHRAYRALKARFKG